MRRCSRALGVGDRHEGRRARASASISRRIAPQLADVLRRRALRRLARGQCSRARREPRGPTACGVAHAAHARAAVALALDEAVVLEADERHADRAAPQAQPAGEVLLDEALAGQQVARHDRVAQGLVSVVVDHGRTDPGLSTGLSTKL